MDEQTQNPRLIYTGTKPHPHMRPAGNEVEVVIDEVVDDLDGAVVLSHHYTTSRRF